ncbi:CCA tRNA nucleotidyltransferase 1, mitochondrial isoform X2 [Chironomus tepperi]
MDPDVKYRENPVVKKMDNDLFRSIFTPELKYLIEIFSKYNYEVRIAGGAVRDLVMGKKPTDLDFATVATPEEMKKMFDAENIRMINMNGEKHGTITARINNQENFECTTLRVDIATDGRHAEVEFTKDWLLDANRRDLTINSMFLGFDGSIFDYFYGYEDLLERKVRFVGNADKRIKEDFLRILRYFRFYGRIADDPDKHDEKTIEIIANNVDGLQNISGERIWVEVKKTLQGKYAEELMLKMVDCGISKFIGLPENPNIEEFKRLKENKIPNVEYNSITLISALLYTPEDAFKVHERLKLSAYERDLMYFIMKSKESDQDFDKLLTFQQMCMQTFVGKPKDVKEYVEEFLKFLCKKDLYEKLKEWEIPRFPIDGATLKKHGCPSGKIMGVIFCRLKEIWAKNEFKSTSDELLIELPKILNELNIVDGKQVKKART